MEDKNFGKLLYLAVALVYWLVQRFGSRRREDAMEQEMLDMDQIEAWEPWEGEKPAVPDAAPATAQPIAEYKDVLERWKAPDPAPVVTATPAAPAAEGQDKKIDRVLRRYSGWKKAIVMSELMRPASAIVS